MSLLKKIFFNVNNENFINLKKFRLNFHMSIVYTIRNSLILVNKHPLSVFPSAASFTTEFTSVPASQPRAPAAHQS